MYSGGVIQSSTLALVRCVNVLRSGDIDLAMRDVASGPATSAATKKGQDKGNAQGIWVAGREVGVRPSQMDITGCRSRSIKMGLPELRSLGIDHTRGRTIRDRGQGTMGEV